MTDRFPTGRWFILVFVAVVGVAVWLRPDRSVRNPQVSPPPVRPERIASPRPDRDRTVPAEAPAGAAAVGFQGGAPVPALFEFVEPAVAVNASGGIRVALGPVRHVRIDRELVESKLSPFWQAPGVGRLAMPLPSGAGALSIVIESTLSLGPRRFTSAGHIEGRPETRAIFGYNEGFMTATVLDPAGSNYELKIATEDLAQYYETNPAVDAYCPGGVAPVIDDAVRAQAARMEAARALADQRAEGTAPDRDMAAATTGTNVQIDLMMLYTQAVLASVNPLQRPAAVQSAFDQAVAMMNDSFQRSQVTARVRLVHVEEVNFPGDEQTAAASGWQSSMLSALRDDTDGVIDGIHAIRDAEGADLVCLVQERDDTQTAGIAYVPELGAANRPFNHLFGFSVVDYEFLFSLQVLSHEIGHNLGSAHDRAAGGTGAYSYSFGYVYEHNGQSYRDIMGTGSGIRLSYFSNPDVTPSETPGSRIGVPIGQPNEASASLTIDNISFEVSTYRLQGQAPGNRGTLLAVSTRALVGTSNEQQLIGGFVVGGSTAKRILLRGVGPAISSAVGNFLRDPVLTLYRIEAGVAVVVRVNDNWGTESNASQIATAGGTPAAPGSRDSALLLDLAPGTYTANVTSGDGTSGTALIEVYEVGATLNRIVALSTRGFASRDAPMIGGFVVEGDPGTTKRIVIRGQGPSLVLDGVIGAMNDPYFTLHNSFGNEIFYNDDWALQNTGGNDFAPTVRYYNERRLSDAQMAPRNRREPAIMLDLPPGLYTTIVRPFEEPGQPAVPGIGLIEVYEIP